MTFAGDTRPWSGLRVRLALAIALVTAAGVGASFLALYGGTGARLNAQIDAQLRTQAAEWRQFSARANDSTAADLKRTATRFIASQRYHAEALVIAFVVSGGPTLSNNSELLDADRARAAAPGGLLSAPVGLTTASVAEAGRMRVLAVAIERDGRRLGTLRVAAPLTPVGDAQSSLLRTFTLVGVLAVLLAAAAGLGLATLLAAPIRRLTAVAAAAAGGDLTVRAGPVAGGGELAVLAGGFDDMLDRLERAFARQRDFVSDASHELRTPLAVLRAQVELLDHESDERRRRESTAQVLRRVDELDRLVGDLLTLAGAEAGQLIELRTIELGGFLEDLRRDLPLFGERDFDFTAVEGTLHADPDRLTQVLRNLIRNAVNHTEPADRVAVAASAHGDRLRLTVSDSGSGIPAEELERIFERFHRVERSRSRDRGGSGLGLAIARAIVEAHGGTIRAETRPGGGARFVLELPGYRAPRAG